MPLRRGEKRSSERRPRGMLSTAGRESRQAAVTRPPRRAAVTRLRQALLPRGCRPAHKLSGHPTHRWRRVFRHGISTSTSTSTSTSNSNSNSTSDDDKLHSAQAPHAALWSAHHGAHPNQGQELTNSGNQWSAHPSAHKTSQHLKCRIIRTIHIHNIIRTIAATAATRASLRPTACPQGRTRRVSRRVSRRVASLRPTPCPQGRTRESRRKRTRRVSRRVSRESRRQRTRFWQRGSRRVSRESLRQRTRFWQRGRARHPLSAMGSPGAASTASTTSMARTAIGDHDRPQHGWQRRHQQLRPRRHEHLCSHLCSCRDRPWRRRRRLTAHSFTAHSFTAHSCTKGRRAARPSFRRRIKPMRSHPFHYQHASAHHGASRHRTRSHHYQHASAHHGASRHRTRSHHYDQCQQLNRRAKSSLHTSCRPQQWWKL